MKALKICHKKCIDSSILFPHPRGFPFRLKLKELAENHLNIVIQRNLSNYVLKNVPEGDKEKDLENTMKNKNDAENENENENGNGNESEIIDKIDKSHDIPKKSISTISSTPHRLGHDSVEDASTAMRLIYLKIQKGPQYGTKIGSSSNARVSLAQFFQGTGICSRIRVENVEKLNGVLNIAMKVKNGKKDETDIHFSENADRQESDSSLLCSEEHSAEHSLETMDISPETSFFSESLSECRAMQACLKSNSTFHPHGLKDELLSKIKNYFGDCENENEIHKNNENSELNENEKTKVTEMENKIIEINRKKNSLKPQKFCYFGLKYSNDMKEFEMKEIISKLQSSLESNGLGYMLIITAQPPLSTVTNLLKQRKACDNAQSVSRWTAALDYQLKEAYSKCNKTQMITITSTS